MRIMMLLFYNNDTSIAKNNTPYTISHPPPLPRQHYRSVAESLAAVHILVYAPCASPFPIPPSTLQLENLGREQSCVAASTSLQTSPSFRLAPVGQMYASLYAEVSVESQ